MKKEDIYDVASKIKNKEDFEEFLRLLLEDLRTNREEWSNQNLDSYLDAMYGFTISMGSYYKNKKEFFDESQITWKNVADILLAAIVYE